MNFKKIFKDILAIKFDKAFGLDIGDRSIEIIELDKFFRFSVVTYGRIELEEGIIENGKILNKNVLAENLKRLLKEAKPRKVSTNKVVVSLPESQVFVDTFEVDINLKAGPLIKTIVDKMSITLPVLIDKLYWDYIEYNLPDKKRKLIMSFGVPKDIANNYVKFCNSVGLEVVSLCSESFNLARTLLKSSTKQSLIMNIGSSSTNLSFFDSNDKIDMAVTIPIAGEQMTKSIEEKLKIERKEAEALKIKSGFSDNDDNPVRSIILPLLEDLLKETKQVIDYYEKVFSQKLDNIYLIGGSSLLPGIVDIIKSNLQIETTLANSAYNIKLNSLDAKKDYFPLFANVIGLGMLGVSSGFSNLNLLKKMPASEVNLVSKLDLLNMGYLSRVNTFRMIINNKFVLFTLVILIGVVFAVLLQQVQIYGFASALSVSVNLAN